MKGSVYKRCACPLERDTRGARKACRLDHGSWEYVADTGRGPDGKRRQQRKAGFPTKKAAAEALTELLNALSKGEYAYDQRQTVGEFLMGWIDGKVGDGALRPTTERSQLQHLRDHLIPQLGHLRLGELRVGHVQAMLRTVKAGPSTVQRVRATPRSALSDAVDAQLITINPAAKVKLPAPSRPKVRPWEPDELGQFLDHAAGDRLGVLYEVMAATGLRRGEACGLRWSDVDLERGRLVVRQQVVVIGHELRFGPPKTASGDARVVDLDAGTVGALLGHRLAQDVERAAWGQAYADHGLVFARESGEPLHPETVTKRFGKLAAGAGCGRSGCTTSDTGRRRSCSPPACRSPSCPSPSATAA